MRIYWQLWLYFHRCGIKSDFYPELFKKLRNNRNLNNIPVGERQMLFVKYASDIAQKNLADFFDMFYIGEGETVYFELLDCYKENKKNGGSRFL